MASDRFTTIAISKTLKSKLDKIKGRSSYNQVLIDLLCTSVLPIEHVISEITEDRLSLLKKRVNHLDKRLVRVSKRYETKKKGKKDKSASSSSDE